MVVAAGTRFGPYEIVEPLGAGGMGEVYRATDGNLGRDVAIKVLPQSFTTDADRVARFQREAKTLAALNHSNIAHIYGLERSGDTTALVMELVAGPTLAERIAQGPLDVAEAHDFALQLAAALEAAHAQGIVHRDLKPANVKLRPDGTVKVLDFGIAKALAPQNFASGPPAQVTPPAVTEIGMVLGTAAYMSPEQARGRAVDERADIWAFGCVLYEMLTGKAAFGDDDATLTVARLIERDPDMTLLPPATPPAARRTIELCLRKDVKERIADIRDVQLMLRGAFDAPPSVAVTEAPARRRRGSAVALASAILTPFILGAIVWSYWPTPAPQPVTRFTTPLPQLGPITPIVAISRDGSRITFRTGTPAQIYVRRFDELEARAVPGTEGVTIPVPPCFSPDNAWVAYSAAGGNQYRKIPLAGGPPVVLADGLDIADWCDWTDEGWIYFGSQAGILRVREAGGPTEVVATPDAANGESSYELPQLLPGGEQLLFTILPTDVGDTTRIAVLDLATRTKRIVVENGGTASYAPTGPGRAQGHLAYAHNGGLFAAPFDLRRLEAGAATTIVPSGIQGLGAMTLAAVSRSGTLAYLVDAGLGDGVLTWIDRDGSEQALPEPAHAYADLALSPDGRRTAVSIGDRQASDLWVYEIDIGRLTRLTFEGFNVSPVWTPDGERLIYFHSAGALTADGELRVVPADNSGPPVTLAPIRRGPPRSTGPTSISPDGKALAGIRNSRGTNSSDVWVMSLDGAPSGVAAADQALRNLLDTTFNERHATFSPDGRFVAYTSDESGRDEIYVVPYPGPGAKSQVSRDGGALPRWNPKGGELFFLSGGKMMVADVETSSAFRALTLRALFDAPLLTGGGIPYDVAPDGMRFMMSRVGAATRVQTAELRVVVNWFEELKRAAPAPAR